MCIYIYIYISADPGRGLAGVWGCFVSIPYALASRLGPLCCLFLRCLLLVASWYCYFLDLHPPYGSPPRLKSATFGGGGGGVKTTPGTLPCYFVCFQEQ